MKYKYLLLIGLGLGVIACKNDDPEPEEPVENDADKTAVLENYASLVYANYTDAHADAVTLQESINAFVDEPSDALFTDVKEAWLQSRESYGTTEAFRFAGGPIDDEDGPEGLLNAWPLDENHIDYVDGDLTSGIINDATTYPSISYSVLEPLNENPGDKDISIGYHAIEFLLWGQDLTLPSAETPGQRAFTDYTTADNAVRRGQYLQVCAEGLVELLQDMKDEWDTSGSNYRSELLASDVDVALTTILGSIAELAESELGGERIAAAYNEADQEEEHSCFSDNTHRDIILNLEGVENVFLGTYNGATPVSGKSLADLLKAADEDTYNDVIDALNAAVASTEGITAPFDYAISTSNASGRATVLNSFIKLQELGDAFVVGGDKLGYTISFEVETVAN